MKHPGVLLILLLLCFWSPTVRAQVADSWVSVSPKGERFTIQMPHSEVVELQGSTVEPFAAEARIYTVRNDGVEYTVWSLVNRASDAPVEIWAYLDICADLVWESLLKPQRDQLLKLPNLATHMSYQRELVASGLPGREYTISLGNKPGLAQFFVTGRRIYVLTVLYADASSAGTRRFISSFDLKNPGLPVGATIIKDPTLEPPSAAAGQGVGPGSEGKIDAGDRNISGGGPSTGTTGTTGGTDYNRVFTGREVTSKARVLSKPEPNYTDSARKYSVEGTIVLRAVISNSGEMVKIRVVKRLPHGLTERAVAAARNIRSTPATKDGHPVQMHIQLEYQFHLY